MDQSKVAQAVATSSQVDEQSKGLPSYDGETKAGGSA